MEISHHEGIENFEKVGCFLLNIINKEYAKKILVMLPDKDILHINIIKKSHLLSYLEHLN